MNKKSSLVWMLLLLTIFVLIIASAISLPVLASAKFGPPTSNLGFIQRLTYSIELLLNDQILSNPNNSSTIERSFEILQGESVTKIADRLQNGGMIPDSHLFQVYLIWKGMDTTIQAGKYTFSQGLNPKEIALELQDATPTQISFNVLAGWRMEEIAAALPTSGLSITPVDFIISAKNLWKSLDYLQQGSSGEGFLFPGSYLIDRGASADDLVSLLIQNFSLYLTPDLIQQYQLSGLDVFQAVTLASIIQREAVNADEKPLISSVFLNRISIGMKLDSDPTVQYAIGFDETQNTWWKNPLTITDLSYDSPYNTYIYPGFPPGPISNPDLSSLLAVAYPAQSTYLYFRALCDGSGLHSFADTFEQHLANACE